MADRTAAESFGNVFGAIAGLRTISPADRSFARFLFKKAQRFDFDTEQMDADPAVVKLGLARAGDLPGGDVEVEPGDSSREDVGVAVKHLGEEVYARDAYEGDAKAYAQFSVIAAAAARAGYGAAPKKALATIQEASKGREREKQRHAPAPAHAGAHSPARSADGSAGKNLAIVGGIGLALYLLSRPSR